MHIDNLRKLHDKLCLELHAEAVLKTNELVDAAYSVFNSNSFNFSIPASRNIYQSQIYFNILNYLLVTRVWKTQAVDITVDSKALRNILREYRNENEISAQISLNRCKYLKDVLKLPVRFVRVIGKMLSIRKCAKLISQPVESVRKNNNVIFVDTYILNGSFNEKGYSNRYFGSFFNQFNDSDKKRTYLVPNFLATSDLVKLRKEVGFFVKSSGFNIFCKESVLSKSDYFVAFLGWIHSFFLGFKRTHILLFELISEELRMKAFSEISFESFVSFLFMKKLKILNLPIKTFVSWNENHLHDRAYSIGYYDFGLSFKFVAYQGVVLDYDYDFYIQPTNAEVNLGLFPRTVYVAGKEFRTEARCTDLVQVKSSPIFRLSSYVSERTTISDIAKNKQVLVGLSLAPALSHEIMNIACELAKMFPEYDFKIRCHPLLPLPIPEGLKNVSYDTEKSVISSLRNSLLLICTGSALILEAAIMQTPTLIVRRTGEYAQNPLPPRFRQAFTNVVTRDSNLKSDFLKIINADADILKSRKLCADLIYSVYVQPIGRQSFEALIG